MTLTWRSISIQKNGCFCYLLACKSLINWSFIRLVGKTYIVLFTQWHCWFYFYNINFAGDYTFFIMVFSSNTLNSRITSHINLAHYQLSLSSSFNLSWELLQQFSSQSEWKFPDFIKYSGILAQVTCHPKGHRTLNPCRCNAGPTSQTRCQCSMLANMAHLKSDRLPLRKRMSQPTRWFVSIPDWSKSSVVDDVSTLL